MPSSVEYELGRARIPFDARRVDTREGFLRELDEFRPHLILSDYTHAPLRRHGCARAGP